MGNVDRLREGHQAFNERRYQDAADGLVAEDAVVTDHARGQTTRSKEEFISWMRDGFSFSSDLAIVDAVYIDGGDYVTARFRGVGTQDGPMNGFPASNRPFSLDVCEVWHFGADGLADEGHNYSDGLGLLIQLGHLQPPPPAGG